MNAMSKSSKAGGCGCGCGGSGGCGCGGQTSGQCASGDVGCATGKDQGFSRPLFFAGQLLTEEDLQSLGDYVVGKSRLHNRHLFGDGVVCGLEVTCNPCGGGTVTVQPGYALDCCGNDLLLTCPAELDINAMARDLRRNLLGGYDCGDPCADKKKQPEPEPPPPPPPPPPATEPPPDLLLSSRGNIVVAPGEPAPAGQTAEPKPAVALRHYCLYARYCEEKTDPVSPYATDDGCSSQACQPTRVREGVSFELRCRACERHDEDIITRLCGCFGDLRVTKDNERIAENLNAFVRLNTQTEKFYSAPLTPADTARAKASFINTTERLRSAPAAEQPTKETTATAEKREAAGVAAAEEKPAESAVSSGAARISDAQLESNVLGIRDAAAHLAAFSVAGSPAAPPDQEVIAAKREMLTRTAETREALKSVPSSSPELIYYASILDGAERLAKAENPAAEVGASELRAIKAGINVSTEVTLSVLEKARALRESLLDALDASPRLGDCGLRQDVRAVRLPASERDPSKEELVVAVRALREAWERYLLDCVCLAFNPPCAKCDDTGVLLACLVVDEEKCEVVEICNMKRKFVISPTALRYWLPPLKWLGMLVEMFCCDEPLCPDELDETDTTGRGSLISSGNIDSAADVGRFVRSGRSDALRLLFNVCEVLPEFLGGHGSARRRFKDTSLNALSRTSGSQMMSILGNLRTAAAKPVSETTGRAATEAARPTAEMIKEVMSDPATRAELFRAFEPELKKAAAAVPDEAAIERKVEERVAAALSGESLNERLAEAMKSESVTKVIGEVAGDAAAGSVDDKLKLTSKDVRELKRAKAENAELKKSITALEERLNKLEGGT